MAKEILLETNIPRAKDKIYYCATSKEGNIVVCCSPMARGRKKSKK